MIGLQSENRELYAQFVFDEADKTTARACPVSVKREWATLVSL